MIYSADSNLKWAQMTSGLIIPADCVSRKQLKAFDFFAGCGGTSCGFHKAGIHVVGALEMDFSAAQTYMVNLGNYPCQIHFDTDERKDAFEKFLTKQIEANFKRTGVASIDVAGSGWIKCADRNRCKCHRGFHEGYTQSGEYSEYHAELNQRPPSIKGCEHFWIADIYNITGKMILSWLEMERGELDIVCGSPPCQGFSRANTSKKKPEFDPRNELTFEYARLICELQPQTMMMENVPELATMHTADGLPILETFCKILADGDYAPFESMRKSLLGMKGAKAVLRSEKKQKVKKEKKRTLGINKQVTKPAPVQPALF